MAQNIDQGLELDALTSTPDAPADTNAPSPALPDLPHQAMSCGKTPPALPLRPAFAVNGTRPLARVLAPVPVHAGPSPQSALIDHLAPDEVVEFQKLWKLEGGWMEIRLPGGSMGYMSSNTKVALLSRVKLKDKEAGLFDNPAADGFPTRKLTKGSLFWLLPKMPADTAPSVVARMDSGQLGYLPSATKITTLAQPACPAVEPAGRDIIVGALWCVGGIVVTAVTYSAASEGGGTYLICWGPVIFGGFQFLRGLFRALAAERAPVYSRENPPRA